MPTTNGKIYLGSVLLSSGAGDPGGGGTPPVADHLKPADWTRPSEWPTVTPPVPPEQKIVGLIAVYPPVGGTDPSWVTFQANCPYTVNWGEGGSEVKTGTNEIAHRQLSWANCTSAAIDINSAVVDTEYWIETLGDTPQADWNTLAGTVGITYEVGDSFRSAVAGSSLGNTTGTISTVPYRFTIATITPNSGETMTSIDFHNEATSDYMDDPPWLEIYISLPSLTTIDPFSTGVQNYTTKHVVILAHNIIDLDLSEMRALECFELSNSANVTNWSLAFFNLYRLRYLSPLDLSNATTLANCFQGTDIDGYPSFSAPNCTNSSDMFSTCRNLRAVGNVNLPACTTAASMFSASSILESIGTFTFSASCSAHSMFASCGFRTFPSINWPTVSLAINFLQNNKSLESIGDITMDAATSAANAFGACPALRTVGNVSFASAVNCVNPFKNCSTLETVGNINIPSATQAYEFFMNCFELKTVGTITTTSALTSAYSFYENCYKLENPSIFNTQNVTGFSSFFAGCDFYEAPWLDTSSGTAFTSMFANCRKLERVPLYDTSSATGMSSMFNACSKLQTVPPFDTSLVTNVSTMFGGCENLKVVPALDLTSATSITSIVNTSTDSVLHTFRAKNIKTTFSVGNNNLSAAALNLIYTNLADVTALGARTITVSGNPGVSGDDPSIATAKGWTVSG